MTTKALLPFLTEGAVIHGFGRGSKALGTPTANLFSDNMPDEFDTGIYCGWASLRGTVYKMVMSFGWNPFYKNKEKSMEVHLLHKFDEDFYGEKLKLILLDYIRNEKDFASVDELIAEIKSDISIAEQRLEEDTFRKYKNHPFLKE